MPRFSIADALAITLLFAASVAAQRLDLPPRLPPPPLDGDTYVANLLAEIEKEIDDFARAERSMPPERRGFARAAIDLRLLASQLLARHERAEPREHVRTLYGLRLAHHRAGLDDMLDRAANLDPAAATAALDALGHFNAAVIDNAFAMREAGATELDAVVPRVIAPLARAGSAVLPGVPVSHWPRDRTVRVDGPVHADADADADTDAKADDVVGDLAHRFAEVDLSPGARLHADAMLDYLDRAARYPDLAPDVERFRGLLDDVLILAAAIERAAWMGPSVADAYRAAVTSIVIALRDPATRRPAERRLQRLAFSRAAIERITALTERALSAEGARTLARALAAVDRFEEHDASDGRDPPSGLARLTAVLDHMFSVRAIESAGLPRDLRPALGKLERECRTAERAVLKALAALADDAAVADPALLSVVADHAQYAEDLARLHRLPDVMATMEAMSPAAGRALRARAAHMRQADRSARRPESVRELDRLEARVAAAAPLPFETALRDGAPPAVIAAGGRHLELLEAADEGRRAWVDAWSRDDDTEAEAARRLDLLVRLVRTMSDSADAMEVDSDRITIDRWAGWEMPRRLVGRAAADLPNRLKLATVSAVAGDDTGLAEQLDRIERDAPLVLLVGHLVRVLADDLAALPDGPRGTLGQLVYPPSSDARLRGHRRRIAELCRYTIEAAFAWDAGHDDRAAAMQRYVNALADDIRAASGG